MGAICLLFQQQASALNVTEAQNISQTTGQPILALAGAAT
jgi:hypothetical protein